MMDKVLADQIGRNMQQKTTEELLAIWSDNDREQWSDAAFDVIRETLTERGVEIPEQRVFALPTPSVRFKWIDVLFSVSFAVILSKALSLLGISGIIPFVAWYCLILLVYFFVVRINRFIRGRLLTRR
jgi:hypothetical protein